MLTDLNVNWVVSLWQILWILGEGHRKEKHFSMHELFFFFPHTNYKDFLGRRVQVNNFYSKSISCSDLVFFPSMICIIWHPLGNNDKTQGKGWQHGGQINNIQANVCSLNTHSILGKATCSGVNTFSPCCFISQTCFSESKWRPLGLWNYSNTTQVLHNRAVQEFISSIYFTNLPSLNKTFRFLNSFLTIAECLRWQKDTMSKCSKQKWK